MNHKCFLALLAITCLLGCRSQKDVDTAETAQVSEMNAVKSETLSGEPSKTEAPLVKSDQNLRVESDAADSQEQFETFDKVGIAKRSEEGNDGAAGSNSPKVKAKEPSTQPEPVSWYERYRFWDMARRVIAEREEQPIELNDAELQKLAKSIKLVSQFHDHIVALHKVNEDRIRFSGKFDDQILAALRGEVWLPDGTRDRRKRLVELPEIELKRDPAEVVRFQLSNDCLDKGSLFQLSIRLREECIEFLMLREHEHVLDEYFLSFPSVTISELEYEGVNDWYPANSKFTLPRELMTSSAPNWFKLGFRALHQANLKNRQFEAVPRVIQPSQLKRMSSLADELEEMSGGKEPLLVFPEIRNLRSRDRVLEAAKRMFSSFREADLAAFNEIMEGKYNGLSDKTKEEIRVLKAGRDRVGEDSFKIRNWGEAGTLEAIELMADAVEAYKDGSFIPKMIPYKFQEDLRRIAKKHRSEVYEVATRFYFSQTE